MQEIKVGAKTKQRVFQIERFLLGTISNSLLLEKLLLEFKIKLKLEMGCLNFNFCLIDGRVKAIKIQFNLHCFCLVLYQITLNQAFRFIAQNTNNLIKEMFKEPIAPDNKVKLYKVYLSDLMLQVVLSNALYFNGSWEYEFLFEPPDLGN